MEGIYIKADYLSKWMRDVYFKDKDLISIDDLINKIDDLDYEITKLRDELEDLKQDVEDNYKFVGTREAIGYDEKTW